MVIGFGAKMSEQIFKEKTVSLMRECLLLAGDRHGYPLGSELKKSGLISEDLDLSDPYKARIAMDGVFKLINWTDPGNIRPLMEIFEAAYAETPRHPRSIHRKLDELLFEDGFVIEDAQLMELAI